MDEIHLKLTSLGVFSFIFMMIGAVSKAGSMPFHTWIPDAADDAPLPFMAFLPGSLEKLLGIYMLARICLDLFKLEPGSPMSLLLMVIGAATILFAVMMALIQKDFKRLLSYHAISQVGYMVLGIGTALPVGIIGGLFHMINHTMYKSCLFFTAGSVERQAGTTDLTKIGGLGRKMPVTFACFIVAAASISGFPLTNGFFSKELIFDGALESNVIFYIIAALGAFFTAVSFLKLGHAAFLGKPGAKTEKVTEAPLPMLIPMIALALGCLGFGLGNSWVLGSVLKPALGSAGEAAGTNWLLVGISVCVLALAFADHLFGFKRSGSGIKSADHIHYAPVLSGVYAMA
jgi:NADH-quinone oxidoreductase subunit L